MVAERKKETIILLLRGWGVRREMADAGLSFGEHATVIEPVELRKRVQKAAERVTAKYSK